MRFRLREHSVQVRIALAIFAYQITLTLSVMGCRFAARRARHLASIQRSSTTKRVTSTGDGPSLDRDALVDLPAETSLLA